MTNAIPHNYRFFPPNSESLRIWRLPLDETGAGRNTLMAATAISGGAAPVRCPERWVATAQ